MRGGAPTALSAALLPQEEVNTDNVSSSAPFNSFCVGITPLCPLASSLYFFETVAGSRKALRCFPETLRTSRRTAPCSCTCCPPPFHPSRSHHCAATDPLASWEAVSGRRACCDGLDLVRRERSVWGPGVLRAAAWPLSLRALRHGQLLHLGLCQPTAQSSSPERVVTAVRRPLVGGGGSQPRRC